MHGMNHLLSFLKGSKVNGNEFINDITRSECHPLYPLIKISSLISHYLINQERIPVIPVSFELSCTN